MATYITGFSSGNDESGSLFGLWGGSGGDANVGVALICSQTGVSALRDSDFAVFAVVHWAAVRDLRAEVHDCARVVDAGGGLGADVSSCAKVDVPTPRGPASVAFREHFEGVARGGRLDGVGCRQRFRIATCHAADVLFLTLASTAVLGLVL